MRELGNGLWHWEARHPSWTPEQGGPEGWEPHVSSYALDDGERLLLFDPLAPPLPVRELASGRHPVVVLTCQWHERDARALVRELGAHLHAPPPDASGERWLHAEVFHVGDRLPFGVEALPGREANDLVLWIEARRALVVGDTLIDRGDGLVLPRTWLAEGDSPEDVLARLRPLLDLPVEHVLPTHGQPTDRAALERALA